MYNETINTPKKVVNGKIITIIVIAAILGILGITLYGYFNKLNPILDDNFSFVITYHDNYIPGSKSEIKVADRKIIIKTTNFCSALDCEPSTKEETFMYSEENYTKLKKFLTENFQNGAEVSQINLDKHTREIVEGITYGEYFFEANVEEYRYLIKYDLNDKTTYGIYFKEDGSVLIKKLYINDDYDITKIDTYPLSFSQKSIDILTEYAIKETDKAGDNAIYKYSTLLKNEQLIFKSIVENKESYLAEYGKVPRLEFTITYDGINCPTPVLYLYSDNTYEYYYTFTSEDKPLTPKTGKYKVDMNQLIANLDNYENEANYSIYTIETEDGTFYSTPSSNKEINDLLTSINVTLTMCTVQE